MAKKVEKQKKSSQTSNLNLLPSRFPQIDRKIPAIKSIIKKIFLLLFTTLLFSYIIFLFLSYKSPKILLLNNLLTDYDQKRSQVNLIQNLFNLSQFNLAQKQINTSLYYFPNDTQILSLQTNLAKAIKAPPKINKEIQKYEKIIEARPNYRDGLLKLAALHYQLYQDKRAKIYLQKALKLDPNFPPALKLQTILFPK